MSGFSLSLRSGKKSSKIKKKNVTKGPNVFGDRGDDKKKTIVKLTHVDDSYCVEPETEKLIIRPIGISKDALPNDIRGNDGMENGKPLSFGLIEASKANGARNMKEKSKINRLGHAQDLDLRWISLLPEVTEEKEYEEVPVEEFGDALLRGMGWDGKENEGEQSSGRSSMKSSISVALPRPQYAGVGAKIETNTNIKRSGDKFAEESFLPIVKIDKKSGKRI